MAKIYGRQNEEREVEKSVSRLTVTYFLYTASDVSSSQSDDPNVYFIPAVLIDGKPIVDFIAYAVSTDELYRSQLLPGTYDILTCWCGVPACAGIGRGVRVVHQGILVSWYDVEPRLGVIYHFDSAQYRNAVMRGIEELRREIVKLRNRPDGSIDTLLSLGADFMNTRLMQ